MRSQIRDAREAGAYRCAPRELASAEAHLDFANARIERGDYFEARDELEAAELAAAAAQTLSPADQCKATPARPSDRDGDGIADAVDRCVSQAEDKDDFEDEDGCPELDNDKDGIADLKDRCPGQAEDRDGFEDEDGCPEPDNDKDEIADAQDKCPNDAEDKDGFEDEDGCPEPDNDKDEIADAQDKCPNEPGPAATSGCPERFSLINVTKDRIELKQTIYFKTNRAVIESRSFPLLEEVARAIKARPSVRVRIEGHTDSRGKRLANIQLSQARADSVRAHLIGLGCDGDRLEAKGFGPDQPVETNKTAAGRERNRRVEFVIVASP